jgi:hypothetical protein
VWHSALSRILTNALNLRSINVLVAGFIVLRPRSFHATLFFDSYRGVGSTHDVLKVGNLAVAIRV